MKLCKCAEDYVKQCNLTDVGLLKVCACSAGLIAGLSIPKKRKTTALTTASVLFGLSLGALMFKLVKTVIKSKEQQDL